MIGPDQKRPQSALTVLFSINDRPPPTSKAPVLGGTWFPTIFILSLKDEIIFDTRSNSGL